MELQAKIQGQGPAVIILHGLLGTMDNWQTIANSISETHTVCLLDLRNHGRSPHAEKMNYHLMAEDVASFMSENWINSAVVIGHSMGGKVAMQLAMDNPDLVEKLIVVDIAPREYKPGHLEIFKALSSIDLKKLKDRREAEKLLSESIDDISTVQFLLKNLSREKDGSFSWKMNLPAIEANYKSIIASIESIEQFEKPTLFIKGSRSNHIVEGDTELINKLFPNSKIVTIEGAGHWVHADKPKELLEIVYKFIE